MRIEHLINGKPKAARDYFETVNPATQEVLAEVASGTAEDIDAAVRAAKDAFPAWAAKPASERAKLVRKLGELIAKNVPELSDTETRDTGKPFRKRASNWCRVPPTTSRTLRRCARVSTVTRIRPIRI
ncbi:hypothetical protein PPGU19_067600 (plasmid) [Paraburkholderia sp. PGU19]|nr:hypothetical protein PPGU19_067600 [Paraburkholderia sp. PGU19]